MQTKKHSQVPIRDRDTHKKMEKEEEPSASHGEVTKRCLSEPGGSDANYKTS